MTEEQEKKVYFSNSLDSVDFCKIKQPLIFKIKYFLFYLFFSGKLDWKNSWFRKNKDCYRQIYNGLIFDEYMNYSFERISESYNTSVKYIGYLVLSTEINTKKDLDKFCNKEFLTTVNKSLIKTPSKYHLMKYFYTKLWTVKHKGATLHFNIFNQLVLKENMENITLSFWSRLIIKIEEKWKIEKKEMQKIF
jgi:hypothetical protein